MFFPGAMAKFFETPAMFRAWLARHGARESELIVGFYKRKTGYQSMSWSESVDEALCFGWIDGVRTRIDEHSYQIRFSPRKPKSIWSAINIEKVSMLEAAGRMTKAGLDAFARRSKDKSRAYSYEQATHHRVPPKTTLHPLTADQGEVSLHRCSLTRARVLSLQWSPR